jgi:hypothetical protein
MKKDKYGNGRSDTEAADGLDLRSANQSELISNYKKMCEQADDSMVEYKDLSNPLGNREHRRKMLAILYKKRKQKAKLEKALSKVNFEIAPYLKYE